MLKAWLLVPRINDITTTPDNPPQYEKLRPSKYPEKNKALQMKAYPDLQPMTLNVRASEALEKVKAAATQLGWKIVNINSTQFRLEAVDITPLMRFRDDVVIEIRPGKNESESLVHMRSRSRLGQSDLGANAARIRRFRDSF